MMNFNGTTTDVFYSTRNLAPTVVYTEAVTGIWIFFFYGIFDCTPVGSVNPEFFFSFHNLI